MSINNLLGKSCACDMMERVFILVRMAAGRSEIAGAACRGTIASELSQKAF